MKVSFNLELNEIKKVKRLSKKEIIGTVGIDNWLYFALKRKQRKKREYDLIKKQNKIDFFYI